MAEAGLDPFRCIYAACQCQWAGDS